MLLNSAQSFCVLLSLRKTPGFQKFKTFYLTETSLPSFCKEVILKVGDTYTCKINVAQIS